MNLLILNGPTDSRPGRNPLYRGTERAHPSYCCGLPDEHEINQLFLWFLEEGGELGVVHDVQKAQRFAQLWNARRTPPDQFEVIEVTGGTASVRGGTFIGFDLSSGYNNSLLAGGLAPLTRAVDLPEQVLESYELISRNFALQLNRHGLFDTFETADLCLRAMNALQQLSPNFFEWGDFQPTGLFVIGAGY